MFFAERAHDMTTTVTVRDGTETVLETPDGRTDGDVI